MGNGRNSVKLIDKFDFGSNNIGYVFELRVEKLTRTRLSDNIFNIFAKN